MRAEEVRIGGGSLIAFFALAFALSWALWLPLAVASRGAVGVPIPTALVTLIGAFGPSLAAVALTLSRDRRPGLRRLLTPLLRWRVSPRWYAVALLR